MTARANLTYGRDPRAVELRIPILCSEQDSLGQKHVIRFGRLALVPVPLQLRACASYLILVGISRKVAHHYGLHCAVLNPVCRALLHVVCCVGETPILKW